MKNRELIGHLSKLPEDAEIKLMDDGVLVDLAGFCQNEDNPNEILLCCDETLHAFS